MKIKFEECVRCAHQKVMDIWGVLCQFSPNPPYKDRCYMKSMPQEIESWVNESDEGRKAIVKFSWPYLEGCVRARIELVDEGGDTWTEIAQLTLWYQPQHSGHDLFEHKFSKDEIVTLELVAHYKRRNERSGGQHSMVLADCEERCRQLFARSPQPV